MTNPIGLPATGQQQNLSNCHDRYLLEARPVGGTVWTPTARYRTPMSAADAARVAADLTALSKRVVYRAVLVSMEA